MADVRIVVPMSFDWMIVTYFFLGGISAGSYFFSVAANYWLKEFKPLAKTAALLTPIALAAGMFFLLIDLGKPLRMWRIYLHFNATSAISWGTWFLSIFLFVSLAYAWCLTRGEDEKAKKFAYAGLPFGFLVATYTAIILAQSPGKELWRHIVAIIPWLFLVGALISGIALVMLVAACSDRRDNALLAKLGRFVTYLIILELALIFTDAIVLLNGSANAVKSAKSFLVGDFSFLFWVPEIILGALIPAIVLLRSGLSAKGYAIVSMSIMIGVYMMRYIVVIGGQIIGS